MAGEIKILSRHTGQVELRVNHSFSGSFLKKCPHLLSFKTISSGSKSARVIAQITSLVDKSENLSSSVMFIICSLLGNTLVGL